MDIDDIDNSTINEIKYNFTINNFDNLLDTFYELKNRSLTCPFFICNMRYIDFENYIESIVFNNQPILRVSDYNINKFALIYHNELAISYDIVNNLTKTYKYTKPNSKLNLYNIWVVFCYRYTDLYRLTKF